MMTTEPIAGESTNEWDSAAPDVKPSLVPEVVVFVAPKWSLSGRLYPHVLKIGTMPIQRTNYQFQVYVSTYAEMEAIQTWAGKEMWFVPNYHDPADHVTYAQQVFVEHVGRPDTKGYQYDSIIVPVRVLDMTT